jgi:hypothetical protein
MGKSSFLKCLLTCALGAYAAGCGDDTSPTAGTGGTGATAGTGATGGTGGGSSVAGSGGSGLPTTEPDEINTDCPQKDVGPMTGMYAPKGPCCYRRSNTIRIDPAAKTRTYEYRLNYFLLTNHAKTISPTVLGPTQRDRAENEEQSLLFRFEMPQAGGKIVDGDGKLTLGVGRYNCDGTYSFYSDKASPAEGGSGKPDRWAAPELPAKVTAAKTDKDRVKPVWKDQLPAKNRESYVPYLGAGPAFALDWEGESQGFDIVDWPTGDENTNCVGSRKDSTSWKFGGHTKSFARLDLNDGAKDVLDSLGVTFCQLMAFGTSGKDIPCKDTARCEPGSADCKWVRLPDSLCPVTADEKTKWACHLGYAGNPDNPAPKCSMDVPATVDPDNGGTVEGQCCDPMGTGKDGLPACNAWININEFVAAAAEITDARSDKLQESCHGK